MKYAAEVCLIALALMSTAVAQDPTKPILRPGIAVEMPVASHAVEMDAVDQENATVVTVTAESQLFIGVTPAEISDLDKLKAETIYVKADARVPFQTVLTVLEALHGHSVALLTAPARTAGGETITPPYGVKLILGSY